MRLRPVAALAIAASLAVPLSAHAELVSSRHKPFYVEGAFPLGVGGYGGYACGRFGCGFGWQWRPDVEIGFHFTGRHDGFVLGIRTPFYVGDGYGGMGVLARIGYDIPIPLKGGKYELTIGPYGYAGFAFIAPNRGISAGLQTGGGAEVKFFVLKGFYVFGRPLDFGIQCFHDYGTCNFQWQAGAGAGYAW
jgi:hypothetical protein